MKTKMKKKMCKKHQIDKYRKCFICGKQYGENLAAHVHSYVHHQAIEHLKGSEQLHKCWACDVSVMGLELYKEHISTRKHTYRLYNLQNTKGCSRRQAKCNIDLTEEEFKALQKQHKNIQKCTETCIVCCQSFPVQDLDAHMHSVIHHQAIEKLKGSPQEHKCWACDMTKTGIAQFKQHVGTQYHKYMLFELQKISADGKPVDYSTELDDELRALCDRRDQQKKERKKEGRLRRKVAKKQRAQLNRKKPATAYEFTNDCLPQECHFMPYFENQNDHPASVQPNQNIPKRKQESILDMDRSNGPLVKRPCLEKPSDNLPHEMPADGTQTPDIEGSTSAGSTCDSGLIQCKMKANKPNPAGMTASSTQETTTENEAVIPKPPPQKHTHCKKATQKDKASLSELDTSREQMNGHEPCADSLPVTEMTESQTLGYDCQAVEMVENVQPRTVRAKKKKSNECETEQGETSLENSFESNSCNARKDKKKKKQDISQSNLNPKINYKTSRKRKVNTLLTLSLKEDELTSSLENVGDELFEAYSTLQSAYTEVQRLLAVKQQVTSEMALLRSKRIKILHDMKNPTMGLNAS
ncbi:uncharacterized protein znf106b [Pseudorasbora parva]|uniref:uncharacterized protein znf106b n=1 Tax=Pseudorasbora parva TaxID=51549 RepID=UPI00351F59B3